MPGLAERVARHVRKRTAAGLDVNGRPFKPRADGTPSRLTESGDMIESFQPRRVDDRGFTLAPSGATAKRAYVHQATGRQWVGVEESVIEQHIEELTDALLDRAGE